MITIIAIAIIVVVVVGVVVVVVVVIILILTIVMTTIILKMIQQIFTIDYLVVTITPPPIIVPLFRTPVNQNTPTQDRRAAADRQ